MARTADVENYIIEAWPSDIRRYVGNKGLPDGSGLVGHNQDGWIHVTFQTDGAALWMLECVANHDTASETAYTSITTAFAHQTVDGDFDYNTGLMTANENIIETARYAAELFHAMHVVRQSDLWAEFSDRIDALVTGGALDLLTWLISQYDNILSIAVNAPHRLIYAGAAYAFGAAITNTRSPLTYADGCIMAAIGIQNDAGYFEEGMT